MQGRFRKSLLDTEEEEFDEVMDVNVKGVFCL
jgi:NAD(P)-dependent dehydrogenase (short-subunit alcohol dehydrogenase family)